MSGAGDCRGPLAVRIIARAMEARQAQAIRPPHNIPDRETGVTQIMEAEPIQEQNAKFLALKATIREGLNSGLSDKTLPQIMEEVEARLRAEGRL